MLSEVACVGNYWSSSSSSSSSDDSWDAFSSFSCDKSEEEGGKEEGGEIKRKVGPVQVSTTPTRGRGKKMPWGAINL